MKACLFLVLLLTALPGRAAHDGTAPDVPPSERLVDLRGTWHFRIGDQAAWSKRDLDESGWETIFAPSAWENEGFFGYDGYAWYRKRFTLAARHKGKSLYLNLGRVDDVDEVFINGYFIGSTGRVPPQYQTGYHIERLYRIPEEFLDFGGDNVVAVRVYDQRLEGGLLEGQLGLFTRVETAPLALNLAGLWRFRTGDDTARRARTFDDRAWDEVTVPARWEPQGYRTYDGYAWYRKDFYLPTNLEGETLTLRLGKIDDLDEVFVNGQRIGGTGRIGRGEIEGSEWLKDRRYRLPPGVLRFGAQNVIAVRVYDGLYDGGLYEGPVGLATRLPVQQEQEPLTFWERVRAQLRDILDK